MYEKKNKNIKVVALLVVLMLLIGGTIGGTLAWLVATTDPVVNTFTVGNITITLDEASIAEANRGSIKMVPGAKIVKDPAVTVVGGSEACWLFVKVEAENTTNFLSYSVRTGEGEWKELDGVDGVYYRQVSASADDQQFYILAGEGDAAYKNGYVTVLSTVTKEMMDKLAKGEIENPKLTFTAYAVQSENNSFNAAQAWNVANGLNPDGTTPGSGT